MTLRQSLFVPPVPLVLAGAYGMLDEIDLETTRTRGSAEQLTGLLAGELDIVVTAIDNLFEWVPAGADVRLIAQVERTTPLVIFGQPEHASLTDLASARFAVDALANGFSLVARRIFADAAIDVSYVEVGGVAKRYEALMAREVDATLLGPPFDSMASRAGFSAVTTINELLPTFPGQGLIVRTDLIRSPEVTAYVAALESAIELSRTLTDQEGIDALQAAGFDFGAADAWAARPSTLQPDASGLELLTQIRESLELLPENVDIRELNSALPRD